MSNVIEFSNPAPSCLIPITHPARAHTPACKTNVAETFSRHSVYQLGDDYDRVNADDWLDRGFKQ